EHGVLDARRIREPALRQPALDRHLAAFEPRRDLAAGARLVALVSATGGAPDAGGRALAAALARLRRSGSRMNVAESHAQPSLRSLTSPRGRALNIMPPIS